MRCHRCEKDPCVCPNRPAPRDAPSRLGDSLLGAAVTAGVGMLAYGAFKLFSDSDSEKASSSAEKRASELEAQNSQLARRVEQVDITKCGKYKKDSEKAKRASELEAQNSQLARRLEHLERTKGAQAANLNEEKSTEVTPSSCSSKMPSAFDAPFDDDDDTRQCVVCTEHLANIGFGPCGHAVVCDLCSPKISTCPMCRARIKTRLRLYF